MAAWIKISVAMKLGVDPGNSVLYWDPVASYPKGGGDEPPNFRPMFIVTTHLDG